MKLSTHKIQSGLLALLLLGVTFAAAAPVHADEMSDLKERFKTRAAQILQLRDAGTIGETFSGWIEAVKPGPDKAVAALITAENADRKRLYALIAAKQSIAAEVVAERNALRIFKSASAEHFLKAQDGTWAKRKDVKIAE